MFDKRPPTISIAEATMLERGANLLRKVLQEFDPFVKARTWQVLLSVRATFKRGYGHFLLKKKFMPSLTKY